MWSFRAVWEGQLCTYCGDEAACAEHAVPICRGGAHEVENMVPACRWCNSSKGTLTADEYRAVLHICQAMRPLRTRLKALQAERGRVLAEFRARAS